MACEPLLSGPDYSEDNISFLSPSGLTRWWNLTTNKGWLDSRTSRRGAGVPIFVFYSVVALSWDVVGYFSGDFSASTFVSDAALLSALVLTTWKLPASSLWRDSCLAGILLVGYIYYQSYTTISTTQYDDQLSAMLLSQFALVLFACGTHSIAICGFQVMAMGFTSMRDSWASNSLINSNSFILVLLIQGCATISELRGAQAALNLRWVEEVLEGIEKSRISQDADCSALAFHKVEHQRLQEGTLASVLRQFEPPQKSQEQSTSTSSLSSMPRPGIATVQFDALDPSLQIIERNHAWTEWYGDELEVLSEWFSPRQFMMFVQWLMCEVHSRVGGQAQHKSYRMLFLTLKETDPSGQSQQRQIFVRFPDIADRINSDIRSFIVLLEEVADQPRLPKQRHHLGQTRNLPWSSRLNSLPESEPHDE